MTVFKTAFGPRQRVAINFEGPSRTKQSFRDECDINNIMRKWQKTGLVTHVSKYQGDYSDLTNVQSYHESCNQVLAAQEAFASLPSSLRSRFQNDPGQFLEFVGNDANRDEAIKLGLITQPEAVSDVSVSDVS